MSNEITVTPLVDILSLQLGEQVVMDGIDGYIRLANLEKVDDDIVAEAVQEQKEKALQEYRASMKISARQARIALLSIGKLSLVQEAISQLASPDKEVAEVTWEYATEIDRLNPFVSMLGAGLGMSDDEIDELFVQGALL